ncbi:uromodulin-like [Leptodactylus fuscus]|uniref:uromodulin-like n=1 Tax=Leptodactylus fuscus TaxID=238119 RepID=UPI003F4EF414
MAHHIIGLLLILCTYAPGWSTTFSSTTGTTSTSYPLSSNSSGYYYDNSSSGYNVTCNDAKAGFPSFSLVVDTTGSMDYYLNWLQDIVWFLSMRLASSSSNITRQYTLMEFNDPKVGPLHVTCSATEFFNAVYYLHTYDGGDCPEYSMVGLLKALEVSPFGSFVVLVTDASAKDSDDIDTVNRIFSLLDSLKVKVFIFTSYSCRSTQDYDFQVYKDIAAYSHGLVFQQYFSNPKAADLLYFFLKIPVNSTTRLFSVDNDIWIYHYNANFSVPSNLTSLIISVSGSINPLILYNPSGSMEKIITFFSEPWGSVFHVDYPRPGIWTLEVYAESYYSLRIEGYKENSALGDSFNVSAFCSTCDRNAVCKKDIVDYTCVCKVGFSGDGFACYDIDECNQWPYPCSFYGYCVNTYGSYNCTCPSGFTLNGTTCVDINECLEPALSNCDPLAACVNYYGSYSCYCPEGYYGDGHKCEINECLEDVCGFGRECIKIPGSHICFDPCFNYTILNEPTRSTSYHDYYYYDYYYYYYGRSDYYLTGWNRFMGSGGTQLAEFCPSEGSCFTRYPMWLDGSHPKPSDGIVNGTVCISDAGTCCQWTSYVMMKTCPGGFYVYKFSQPPVYSSGYCTDPTTTPGSCYCADDEECRAVSGHYSCYCKSDSSATALEDIRPVLSCGSQEIKASFQKCDLKKFNLDTKNIHLIDNTCVGFSDFNTTNIISVVSILKRGVCGNELVNNGTHVIYKNTIFLSLDVASSLGGENVLSIRYSCVYPLDMQLSLETALKPFSGSAIVDMEGTGKLQVTMALYKDSSYITPYEGSEVILTSATNLFIGILLKIGDISQYAVQITNCYAVPSINSTTKYDIIKNSCPVMQDSSIKVIENGASGNGRFSVQLFRYIKDSNVVYLYCDIHICSMTCTPTCTGVRALSTTDSVTTDASLVVGPIYKQAESCVNTPSTGRGTYSMVETWVTVVFLWGTVYFTL